MKNGREHSRNFTTNDTARRYQKFVLSALINSIDIYTAAQIIVNVVIVFDSKMKISDFYEALTYIKSIIDVGEVDVSDNNEMNDINEDLEIENKHISSELYYQSPFFYFLKGW